MLADVPPIVVHQQTMRVIDGVHRVLAARSRGQTTIRAVLFEGTELEASIEAVRCNIAHGKPLTLAEREAAAERILAVHPEWSDRRMAEVCGLAAKTVGRVRERATGDPAQLGGARVGRDGKVRPLDPIEVRHRIASAIRADPDASIRAIAGRTGASQGTVRDVRARVQQGRDVLSPRLAETLERRRAEEAERRALTDDQACVTSEAGSRFAEWFESLQVTEPGQWEPFVPVIPISRVYEVADAARRCGKQWEAFAAALEARARKRRG